MNPGLERSTRREWPAPKLCAESAIDFVCTKREFFEVKVGAVLSSVSTTVFILTVELTDRDECQLPAGPQRPRCKTRGTFGCLARIGFDVPLLLIPGSEKRRKVLCSS